jgi:hypothetical protein
VETQVRLIAGPGEEVNLLLTGPEKAVRELIDRLRALGGPLDVTGGTCCWTLSRAGSTLHVVVDQDKVAS